MIVVAFDVENSATDRDLLAPPDDVRSSAGVRVVHVGGQSAASGLMGPSAIHSNFTSVTSGLLSFARNWAIAFEPTLPF